MNAAVLPVPVWAAASRSRPASTSGMACVLDGGGLRIALIRDGAEDVGRKAEMIEGQAGSWWPVGPEPCGRIVVHDADRARWPRGPVSGPCASFGAEHSPSDLERHETHARPNAGLIGLSRRCASRAGQPGRVSTARPGVRADVPRVGDRGKVRGAARWIRRDRQRRPARSRVSAPSGSSRSVAVDAHRVLEPSPGPLGLAVDSVGRGPLGVRLLRRSGRPSSPGPGSRTRRGRRSGESKSAGAVRLRRSQIPPREPPSRRQSPSMGREDRPAPGRPTRGGLVPPGLCGAAGTTGGRSGRVRRGAVRLDWSRTVRSGLAEPRRSVRRARGRRADTWRDLGRGAWNSDAR